MRTLRGHPAAACPGMCSGCRPCCRLLWPRPHSPPPPCSLGCGGAVAHPGARVVCALARARRLLPAGRSVRPALQLQVWPPPASAADCLGRCGTSVGAGCGVLQGGSQRRPCLAAARRTPRSPAPLQWALGALVQQGRPPCHLGGPAPHERPGSLHPAPRSWAARHHCPAHPCAALHPACSAARLCLTLWRQRSTAGAWPSCPTPFKS